LQFAVYKIASSKLRAISKLHLLRACSRTTVAPSCVSTNKNFI